MEYRFTDANKATVTFDMTLGQIEDMRKLYELVLTGDVSGVSRWQVRQMIRKLAEAQRQAADLLAIEAKALAEKAQLSDSI